MKDSIQQIFIDQFGKPAEHTIYAPGRANIIGEHTDYNDGYVLPFAIAQGIWFGAAANDSQRLNIKAFNTDQTVHIDLQTLEISNDVGWAKFFIQVLKTFDFVALNGLDIVFGGDLPIGAGISSSSALTCGLISLLNNVWQLNLSTSELVQNAVNAERGYGVRGGIMDQFTIFNGRKNQAILLDCKTNTHEYVPLDMGQFKFYLFNTKVQHNLLHTDYNSRRDECDLAVNLINKHYKKVTSLRDIDMEDLTNLQSMLDVTSFNRVSFVVQENHRVIKAKYALLQNDFEALGLLLYESHDGLSQMYQVSCAELDWLVAYTLDFDQIAGARMMGGGFGGCTINLVKGELSTHFITEMTLKYKQQFGFDPEIFEVIPSDGILDLHH
jgi:galactokinase